jgi:hypothetical protein
MSGEIRFVSGFLTVNFGRIIQTTKEADETTKDTQQTTIAADKTTKEAPQTTIAADETTKAASQTTNTPPHTFPTLQIKNEIVI